MTTPVDQDYLISGTIQIVVRASDRATALRRAREREASLNRSPSVTVRFDKITRWTSLPDAD